MKKVFYQIIAIIFLLPLFQCERATIEPSQTPIKEINYEDFLQSREFTYAPELETYQVPKEEVRAKIRSYLNGEGSRTDYSIQEAIWYIEALPNYFEGNASVHYKSLAITEHYYYIGNDANARFSSQQIDEFAVTISQQAVADKQAAQCANNEKNTIIINISPMTDSSGDIYLKTTTGTGLECNLPADDERPVPYIDDDPCDLSSSLFSWTSIGEEGTCGNGPQSNAFDNAAKVIEDRINSFDDNINSCPMRYAFPTENGFFANNSNSPEIYSSYPFQNVFENPNDNTLYDGYRDYWLLESWEGQAHPLVNCLDPDEMEYYRESAYSVIYWYMNNNDPNYDFDTEGKMFAMCLMWGDVLPTGFANRHHGIEIHYGDYVP